MGMKVVLALVIAVMSALLGATVVAARSAHSVRWTVLLISVGLGALLAEGITVVWSGPPTSALPPAIDGVVLGALVGWVAGRKRPGPPA